MNLPSEDDGEEGDTMLHVACAQGLEEIALFLVSHGASVNARCAKCLDTPPLQTLCMAIKKDTYSSQAGTFKHIHTERKIGSFALILLSFFEMPQTYAAHLYLFDIE